MLVGHERVQVWRKTKHNRDGDADYQQCGVIDGCSLQVEGLRGTEHTVRSDGVTRSATETDATLYLFRQEDVRKGDRVVNTADNQAYEVNTDPIWHTYPSGHVAGSKCFLKRVEKW